MKIAVLVAAALLLAGCSLTPRYHVPGVAAPHSYSEVEGWKGARPADQAPRGPWWELFGDAQLNGLQKQVAAANQNLKVMEARFREARTAIRFNRAARFPFLSAAPAVSSLRSSANRPYIPSGAAHQTSDFNLPLDLSYEVDLWGRVRSSIAAARTSAQAAAADFETARLSLQAELALDYFELRSADAQQRLLEHTVESYAQALRFTRNRFEGGAAPKSDVAQAETQLRQAQVQLTDIAVVRAQYEHAIAALIGLPPAEFHLAAEPLSQDPPGVPVSVPSQLLERRPDIAAAERRVASANEQIGIARAAFYPTLLLGALGGFEGSSLTSWMNWPSRFWGIGPTLAQTLFDGGRRHALSESAVASYDAAVAAYRQATLDAFRQVEDNLAALRILESEAQQQRQAVLSAEESLQLFTNRYKGGVDTYLQVVTAQTTALANQRNETDIRRRRMDATVLLIKALGGGWDASSLPAL